MAVLSSMTATTAAANGFFAGGSAAWSSRGR
jgi:hypothetical protein